MVVSGVRAVDSMVHHEAAQFVSGDDDIVDGAFCEDAAFVQGDLPAHIVCIAVACSGLYNSGVGPSPDA